MVMMRRELQAMVPRRLLKQPQLRLRVEVETEAEAEAEAGHSTDQANLI